LVVAYLAVDLSTGWLIFGIVPVSLAVRARRRQERLWPVAAVAATAAVVVGIAALIAR
jgi:hypothetical protein